ncbi:LuxR C-terminal-related transcriptional regulator [Paraburkholderia caffeinilytica]|uniref:LuxR C-terminal-related transcriptional regulator n=1 Tax=Paraburkholderia caffeinilytica TaxID=1761016 RepID=UPI003D9FB37D
MEVTRTRLASPVEAVEPIARPRLIARLNHIEHARLTVVQAPAGYGKTSLLTQWLKAITMMGKAAGWITVDGSGCDASGFLSYVAAALAKAAPSREGEFLRLIDTERYLPPSLLATSISNLLCDVDSAVFLFIDDTHLLDPGALDALRRLLDQLPANTHFIVASRTVPAVPLSRLRAQGQLIEIGVDDLRFRDKEALQYLASVGHQRRGEELLRALTERAEGWITALKLAALALQRDAAPIAFASSFTGTRRAISDFFAEEVLASLDAPVRDFLLKTSVLERMSPALCDALTGTANARDMLDRVEAAGLFLAALDEEREWYRYHLLFAEFLRRHLTSRDPQLSRELLLRASDWFFQHAQYTDAVEHALQAGEPTRAAAILEACCQDWAYSGRIRLVAKFATQIPRDILTRYPTILLTWAWLLTRHLSFDEAQQMLDTVRAHLEQQLGNGTLSATEARPVMYLLQHREMTLAAAQDDAMLVEEKCTVLLAEYREETHPYLTGTIYAQLAYSQRERYKLTDVERYAALAHGVLARSGFDFALISAQASIGPSLFFAGKTDAALRALEEGLEQATAYGGIDSALVALPAMPLAEILYDRNEIERASQLLASGLPLVTEFGFVDQLMPGYSTLARIRASQGDHDGAMRALDQGICIALDRNLPRLRLGLVAEKIRLLVLAGTEPRQLAEYARSCEVPSSAEGLRPLANVTSVDESRAFAWAQTAIVQDHLSDAFALVKQWRSFCHAAGAVRSLLRWTILLAKILLREGDPRAARRALREALALAAPQGLIRSFIDEGPWLRTLLSDGDAVTPQSAHPTDVFAAHVLTAFDESGAQRLPSISPAEPLEGLYGALSSTELEVLTLVASGLRNREVALKLGTTEGSIKWHMQQVYDKIGTRRRLQAIERARALGLIH